MLALAQQVEESAATRHATVVARHTEGETAAKLRVSEFAQLQRMKDDRVAELHARGIRVPRALLTYDPSSAVQEDYKRCLRTLTG